MTTKRKGIAPYVILGYLLVVIALIALKATGLVDWGWLWVLAPVWMPIAIGVIGGMA